MNITHLAHHRLGPNFELFRACAPTVPLEPLAPEHGLDDDAPDAVRPTFCPDCLTAARSLTRTPRCRTRP